MALAGVLKGSSGGGTPSKSGTFIVPASSWGTVDCGFVPKKVYIVFEGGSNAAVGHCVYDEELGTYQYGFRYSSSFYTRTFAEFFSITSNGFKMRSDFTSSSMALNCQYLAVG